MTWTPEGRITMDDLKDWEKRLYEQERPVREQVITAYEVAESDLQWIAYLTADQQFFASGTTEEEAIGRLWLTYPHLIIEKCRSL